MQCVFFSFSGLLKHYNTNHPDYQSTNTAMVKIQSVIRKMSVKLRESVSISHNWLSKSSIPVLTLIIYQTGKLCETGRITTWSWGLWAFVATWKRISKRRLPTKAVKERIPTENVLLGKYFFKTCLLAYQYRHRALQYITWYTAVLCVYTAVDCAFHYRSSDL